jgi:hypothetical protein
MQFSLFSKILSHPKLLGRNVKRRLASRCIVVLFNLNIKEIGQMETLNMKGYENSQKISFSKWNRLVFFLIPLLALTTNAWAEPLSLESGPQKVTMIELFSSEGCSSCPPADRQLANLKSNKILLKDFVPIEFHVDYWNYLGWTDPFSNQQFSQRQRSYAREWGNGRVYTPGFVVNGKEYPLGRALPTSKAESRPGNLKVEQVKGNSFKVTFASSAQLKNSNLIVHAALLGNGLVSKIPSGENAGETLQHEFVVLKHSSHPLSKKNKTYQTVVSLGSAKKSKAQSYSVAFWVTKSDSQMPIQAVGGNLPSL